MRRTRGKKLYRQRFIVTTLPAELFATSPFQGNAEDRLLMGMARRLALHGINSIHQLEPGKLARHNHLADQVNCLDSLIHFRSPATRHYKPGRLNRSAPPRKLRVLWPE